MTLGPDLLEEAADSIGVASRCSDQESDSFCAYYKKQGMCGKTDWMRTNCCKTCSTTSGRPSSSLPTIRVVSYNLNAWKSHGEMHRIISFIRSTQADSLGLQECSDPGAVPLMTGNMYRAVS